jgi:hypothetical protein
VSHRCVNNSYALYCISVSKGTTNPVIKKACELQDIPKKNATILNYCNYVNYYKYSDEYILQQDGAPPHFHREVGKLLNHVLPQRLVGRHWPNENLLLLWPPRSPDLTPCDFFLWSYVKDIVYVP